MAILDFLKGFSGMLTGEKDDEVGKTDDGQKDTTAQFSGTEKTDLYSTPIPEEMKKKAGESLSEKKLKYAKENAGWQDAGELGFSATKKAWSDLVSDPSDPIKGVKGYGIPKLALTAAGSALDRLWNNTIDRIPGVSKGYDEKVQESVDEIYGKAHNKTVESQTKNNDNIAKTNLMKNNIDMEEQAIANLSSASKAEEEALSKATVFDTDYYNRKKKLENDKISILDRAKTLQEEKNKFIEARENQAIYEMNERGRIAGFTFSDEQTSKYKNNIVDTVYTKDGKRFGETNEEAQTKSIISNLEKSIMESGNDAVSVMDLDVYTKSSIVDNDEITNMMGDVLSSVRDGIMSKFNDLSDEKTLSSGEVVRVINNDKVRAYLESNFGEKLDVLDKKISDIKRNSFDEMRNYYDPYSSRIYKERGVLEGARDNFIASKDYTMQAVSDMTKSNISALSDKSQWIREAVSQDTLLGNAGRYVASNWFELGYNAISLVQAFGSTALTKSARAAELMNEANVLTKQLNSMQRALKVGEEITDEMKTIQAAISKLNTEASIIEGGSLAGKIQDAGLDWTNSIGKNKMLNTFIRKASGVLDEVLVSIPSDIAFGSRKDDASDIRTNFIFNALPGFTKIKNLAETDKIAKWVSGLPEGDRLSKFEEHTGLRGLNIDLAGDDSKKIESEIKRAINRWGKAVIGTDKGKAALAAISMINRDIEAMDYEQIKQLGQIAGAIENDKTLGVSLAKNTSKDITSIITKAEALKKDAHDDVSIIDIENKAAQEVKNRLKRFASSFDATTLNKIYKKDLAKSQLEGAHDLFAANVASAIGANPISVRLALAEFMLKGDISISAKQKFSQMIAEKVAKGEIPIDSSLLDQADAAKLYKTTMDATTKAIDEAGNFDGVISLTKSVEKDPVAAGEALARASGASMKKRAQSLTSDNVKQVEVKEVPIKEKQTSPSVQQGQAIYDNAEKIVKSFLEDNGGLTLTDNQALTRKAISEYAKTKYGINMQSETPTTLNVAVSIASRTSAEFAGDNKVYRDSIGLVGEGTTSDMLMKKLGKENEVISKSFDELEGYETSIDIVNTMLSKLSKGDNKTAKSIVDGIGNFLSMAKEKGAIIKVSKLDDGVQAMVNIVKGDSAQKIILGISSEMINRMEKFLKTESPSRDDIKSFTEDMGILLHEIGHMVSTNIDPAIRGFIVSNLKGNIVSGSKELNVNAIKDIVGDGVFANRIKYYANLFNNNELDRLAEEVFADKFMKDMNEAISNPEAYSQKMAEIISGTKEKNLKKIYTILADQVKKVAEFVRSIIETGRLAGGNKNISDVMSLINYAAIKGDLQYHWGVGGGTNEFFHFKNTDDVKFSRNIPGMENIDNYTKTLLDSGIARDEALKVIAGIKDKSDVVISETMLTTRGIELLDNILQGLYGASTKDIAKYRKIINDSKVANQKSLIGKYYYLKSMLYNGEKLKIGGGLNRLLTSLPKRISSGVGRVTSHVGGVFMDPKLELIKYMINSDFDGGMKYMEEFYNSFFNKFSSSKILGSYTPSFVKKILGVDDVSRTGEAITTLYKGVREKMIPELISLGYSEKVADDILNPLLYNPFEYIIGTSESVFTKGDDIYDMIMAVLTRRHGAKYSIMDSKLEQKYYDMFDRMPKGANARNRQISILSNAFGEFMDQKGGDIVMKGQDFAEYVNKIIGYSLYGDNIGRNQTILDNTISLLLKDYANAGATKAQLDELDRILSAIPYDQTYGKLKGSSQMIEDFSAAKDQIAKLGLPSSVDVTDTIEAIEKSMVEMANTKESTILAEYLMHRFNKSQNIELLSKDADKNIIDIEDEIEATAEANRLIEQKANALDENALADAILRQKKGKDGRISQSTINKTAAQFGVSDIEAETAIVGGVDLSKLISDPNGLDNGAMSAMVFSNILNGEVGYLQLLNSSEPFRNMIRESFDASYKKAIRDGGFDGHIETYTIDPAGNYISKHDDMINSRLSNWLNRVLSGGVTAGKLMSDDEGQTIIGKLVNNRKKSTIYTKLDLSSVFPNLEGKKAMNIQTFTSGSKQRFNELTKGMSNSDVLNIMSKIISSGSQDASQMGPKAKALHDFLSEYYASISRYRQRYSFGDYWYNFMSGVTDKNAKSAIGNRMTSLSNYLSNDDLSRLGEKYGMAKKSSDGETVLNTFIQDVMFGGRSDRTSAGLGFDKFVSMAMQAEMLKLYGPTAFYKGFQQMISNESQAKGILSSSRANEKYVDQFMAILGDADQGFSIGPKDMAEGLLGEKTVGGKKWNLLQDILGQTNMLMWGDKATKKRALRSSYSIALSDIVDVEGDEGLKFFARDINRFTEFKRKYGITDDDLINPTNFYRKMEGVAKTMTRKSPIAERASMIKAILDEATSNASFFRNYYEPFAGKVRSSMGVFYVMDNIPELGSIRMIDNHRWSFGLMKRAVGKTSEYAYDIHSAIRKHPLTLKGFSDALREPVFKRLFTDIAVSSKLGWLVDRATGGENETSSVLSAVCVPIAAFSMLIGSDIMSAVREAKGSYDRGNSAIQSIGKGTIDMVKNITDRQFIWLSMLAQDILKISATAGAGNTGMDKLGMGWEEFLKIEFINQFNKYYKINTQGVKTDASELLNWETIVSEYILGTTSTKRDKLTRIANDIYDSRLENNKEDYGTSVLQEYLPWLKAGTPDVGVMLGATKEYIEEKGLDWFVKNGAPIGKIMELIDESEINKAINGDMKNVPAIDRDKITPENVLSMGIKYGFITEDVEAFKTITEGLKGTSAEGKDLMSMWYGSMSKPKIDEFESIARKFFDEKYNIKKKGYTLTQKDFTEFVNMASKFGGSASMGTYMAIFANEYKSAVAKELGLTSGEISAAKTGDAIAFSEGSAKEEAYMQYITLSREAQKALIKDNWSWIQGEKHIGIELMNKYMANDKGGLPLGKYGTALSQLKSNVAKGLFIEQMSQIRKEEGYQGLIYPLSMLQLKSIDSYANIDMSRVGVEGLARAGKSLIKTNNDILDIANSKNDPMLSQIVKVGLASSMYKFQTKLDTLDPNISNQVKELIGKENITSAVNSLTDSPPSSIMTAFEQVFDTNLHPGWGKGRKAPDAKVIKNAAKAFIADYNKLSKGAAAQQEGGSPNLPRKYTYVTNSEGTGLVPVRIDIKPTDGRTSTQQIRGQGTSSSKLEVTKLPIKEGRVLGGTYRAGAIKGAKVYARKIGGKRV